MTQAVHLFGRQAIPMMWDFAEPNVFGRAAGDYGISLGSLAKVLDRLRPSGVSTATQRDAQTLIYPSRRMISTDPPYYDNIGYADLSDFFYVWLRRPLLRIFPDLFSTLAVPKDEELVATPYRHESREDAEEFFIDGMKSAMRHIARQAHSDFPVTIYYAFKQSEKRDGGKTGSISTGWETFLEAVTDSGLGITGTWPMRTERGHRMVSMDANALASSIVLVCRPRTQEAPKATRRDFVLALKRDLRAAVIDFQRAGIAPVDLAQAAIGPGMATYTGLDEVRHPGGARVGVGEALALINEVLEEILSGQDAVLDGDTRWAVAWYETHGFGTAPFGEANTLATAKNTSVAGLVEAGILHARSGQVRLLRPEELPEDWNPATDRRLTVWKMVQHLVRVLEGEGEIAAGQVLRRIGGQAGAARELAYRLYGVCERQKRAAEARAYNSLVISWPELARIAREDPGKTQALF